MKRHLLIDLTAVCDLFTYSFILQLITDKSIPTSVACAVMEQEEERK